MSRDTVDYAQLTRQVYDQAGTWRAVSRELRPHGNIWSFAYWRKLAAGELSPTWYQKNVLRSWHPDLDPLPTPPLWLAVRETFGELAAEMEVLSTRPKKALLVDRDMVALSRSQAALLGHVTEVTCDRRMDPEYRAYQQTRSSINLSKSLAGMFRATKAAASKQLDINLTNDQFFVLVIAPALREFRVSLRNPRHREALARQIERAGVN